LIMAGEVLISGKPIYKAGTMVAENTDIHIVEPPAFVSRGGLKLKCAIEQFKLDVSDKIAADIGASTGGFTDCLLQHGAKRVYAIDVGTNQLDYRLRRDNRVITMEGINARYSISLSEKVDLATLDLSFISLEKVIPSVIELLTVNAYMIVLLKPQFEARREEVGKGGIIKDPAVHARIIGRFINYVVNHDLRLNGLINSPIFGSSGNREFLALLTRTTKINKI
jgi:23S rRNA (cytidine1920-2'-O)/16S rRNA (cytidine1409-2'-O)-methyltransferase